MCFGAPAGRDYSKPWLRKEIDRLVAEAETAQEQAQGVWKPGTVRCHYCCVRVAEA